MNRVEEVIVELVKNKDMRQYVAYLKWRFSLVDIRDIISFYVLHELIHLGRFLLVTGHFWPVS